MSAAFKCDRCPAMEQGEPVASVTFTTECEAANGDKKTRAVTHEFCSGCLGSLRDWRDEYSTIANDKDTAE